MITELLAKHYQIKHTLSAVVIKLARLELIQLGKVNKVGTSEGCTAGWLQLLSFAFRWPPKLTE